MKLSTRIDYSNAVIDEQHGTPQVDYSRLKSFYSLESGNTTLDIIPHRQQAVTDLHKLRKVGSHARLYYCVRSAKGHIRKYRMKT